MSLDVFSILSQATAFVVWPMIEKKSVMWLIPVSVLLISCGWWENYVSEDSPIPMLRNLGKVNKNFQNSRYFSYLFISIWKCFLFFVTVLIIVRVNEGSCSYLFSEFDAAFKEHYINVTEVCVLLNARYIILYPFFILDITDGR